MRRRYVSTGFTIVELLIVIVVIGILAALVISTLSSAQTRAQVSKITTDLKAIQKAVELYKADTGSYPSTGGGWSYSANSPTAFVPSVAPAYIKALPQLSIGTVSVSNCYIYKSNGTDYKIMRLGQPLPQAEQDAVPDGMKDLGNWSSYKDRYGFWSPGGAYF